MAKKSLHYDDGWTETWVPESSSIDHLTPHSSINNKEKHRLNFAPDVANGETLTVVHLLGNFSHMICCLGFAANCKMIFLTAFSTLLVVSQTDAWLCTITCVMTAENLEQLVACCRLVSSLLAAHASLRFYVCLNHNTGDNSSPLYMSCYLMHGCRLWKLHDSWYEKQNSLEHWPVIPWQTDCHCVISHSLASLRATSIVKVLFWGVSSKAHHWIEHTNWSRICSIRLLNGCESTQMSWQRRVMNWFAVFPEGKSLARKRSAHTQDSTPQQIVHWAHALPSCTDCYMCNKLKRRPKSVIPLSPCVIQKRTTTLSKVRIHSPPSRRART